MKKSQEGGAGMTITGAKAEEQTCLEQEDRMERHSSRKWQIGVDWQTGDDWQKSQANWSVLEVGRNIAPHQGEKEEIKREQKDQPETICGQRGGSQREMQKVKSGSHQISQMSGIQGEVSGSASGFMSMKQ